MKKKLLSLASAVLVSVSGMAQTWTGETPKAGDYYLYNVGQNGFVVETSGGSSFTTTTLEATKFTITSGTSSSFAYSLNGTTYYLYQYKGDNSQSTTSLSWTISSYGSGYQIWSKNGDDYKRYLVSTGSGISNSRQTGEYNNDNGTWLFVSANQFLAETAESEGNATSYIVNPSFEGDTNGTFSATNGGGNLNAPTGWIVDGKCGWVDGSLNDAAPKHGSKCYNLWSNTMESFDVYQNVTLPAGSYRMTADLRIDDANFSGDQRIYAVVDGKEVNSGLTANLSVANPWNSVEGWNTKSVEFTLKTAGEVRLGIKSSNDGTSQKGWFQVDNFTLSCTEMMDNSNLMPDSWVGQTNTWNGTYSERYGGDATNFAVGNVLYQTISGLAPGYYQVEIFASARAAQWGAGGVKFGEGIAKVFVNDIDEDLLVVEDKGISDVNAAELNHSIIAYVGNDGTMTYGIKNVEEGGNWYVCKAKGMTYLGDKISNLAVKAGMYGTFIAPFAAAKPAGVELYTCGGANASGVLTLTSADAIEAGKPYITKSRGGAVNETLYGKATANEATYTEGLLTGVLGADQKVPNGSYILSTKDDVQAFYKVATDKYVAQAGKCYITMPSASPVKALYFAEDADAIKTLEALTNNEAKIYDLNGRQLNSLQKGINIVNGRKVMVK